MGDKITILGPGLLGASLGMAVREHGLFDTVHAWSRRDETRKKCRAQPWCDAVWETAEEAVEDADITVICAPVQVIPELLVKISDHLKPGSVLTDVGSTKTSICNAAEKYLQKDISFVGSHPMAGSEKTGLENAHSGLFKGQACILTPTIQSNAEGLKIIRNFWETLGMQVGETSPADHDRIVAAVSHLPHILASALCENLLKKDPAWKAFSGKGLRDTTRVAAGDAELWRQILDDNSPAILEVLKQFSNDLTQFSEALKKGDLQCVQQILRDGKIFRDSL
ncbi:MAG: prephenate dehydrogenase/arogenate dehydrogenase family protein [Opitutae bacterium]|nr:prephenate dehydrogenase/arogenate dehydrogenase family protein [Opitutae bacterium]